MRQEDKIEREREKGRKVNTTTTTATTLTPNMNNELASYNLRSQFCSFPPFLPLSVSLHVSFSSLSFPSLSFPSFSRKVNVLLKRCSGKNLVNQKERGRKGSMWVKGRGWRRERGGWAWERNIKRKKEEKSWQKEGKNFSFQQFRGCRILMKCLFMTFLSSLECIILHIYTRRYNTIYIRGYNTIEFRGFWNQSLTRHLDSMLNFGSEFNSFQNPSYRETDRE